jgi:hypothetical protein
VPLVKTLGVGEDVDCVVIGTLFKQQRLRPSVLDEYTKDGALKQVRVRGGRRALRGRQLRLLAALPKAPTTLAGRAPGRACGILPFTSLPKSQRVGRSLALCGSGCVCERGSWGSSRACKHQVTPAASASARVHSFILKRIPVPLPAASFDRPWV